MLTSESANKSFVSCVSLFFQAKFIKVEYTRNVSFEKLPVFLRNVSYFSIKQ